MRDENFVTTFECIFAVCSARLLEAQTEVLRQTARGKASFIRRGAGKSRANF